MDIPGKDLLPEWFLDEFSAVQYQGLLLSNGTVLVVTAIRQVSQAKDGSLWVDVELASHGDTRLDFTSWPLNSTVTGAPAELNFAAVSLDHVMAVIALSD